MVVVVDVPDVERVGSVLLAGPFAGVEELLGQDPVVGLDLPVVAWSVRPDELVRTPARARANTAER